MQDSEFQIMHFSYKYARLCRHLLLCVHLFGQGFNAHTKILVGPSIRSRKSSVLHFFSFISHLWFYCCCCFKLLYPFIFTGFFSAGVWWWIHSNHFFERYSSSWSFFSQRVVQVNMIGKTKYHKISFITSHSHPADHQHISNISFVCVCCSLDLFHRTLAFVFQLVQQKTSSKTDIFSSWRLKKKSFSIRK